MWSNPNFSTVVTDLSDAVVKELGVDGLKFVIAVGDDGNLKLFKPAQGDVTVLTDVDPLNNAEIDRILSWAITSYEELDKSFIYYCGGRICKIGGVKIC